jgi:hypothetical protein
MIAERMFWSRTFRRTTIIIAVLRLSNSRVWNPVLIVQKHLKACCVPLVTRQHIEIKILSLLFLTIQGKGLSD